MGKIIICVSKNVGPSLMNIYLNNQLICGQRRYETKFFEVNNGVYSFDCMNSNYSLSKNDVNRVIDLNGKNVKVTIKQGFASLKTEVIPLSDYELRNVMFERINIYPGNMVFASNMGKKKESTLSILGRIFGIIILFLVFCGGFSFIGKETQSTGSKNFPYTITEQSVNDYGLYQIQGVVTNNSGQEIDGLKIEFKCYDDSGQRIGIASDYMEHVADGESWSYHARLAGDSSKVNYCEFYAITPYTTIAEIR